MGYLSTVVGMLPVAGKPPSRSTRSALLVRGALFTGSLLGCWLAADEAFAQNNIIGFGPGFYADSSERTDKSEPDLGGIDGSQDLKADSYLNLQLWYLRKSNRLLYGGGVAFFNDFTVVVDDDEQDDPETTQYGNMFELFLEGDFLVPLDNTGHFDLLLGARGGLLTLFQSRDLEREIEDQANLGVSVWPSMPRFGAFVGPHVGALWGFSNRVSLRADFGVQFAWLSLYSGEGEGAFVGTIERSATLTTTRFQGVLGLHVHF